MVRLKEFFAPLASFELITFIGGFSFFSFPVLFIKSLWDTGSVGLHYDVGYIVRTGSVRYPFHKIITWWERKPTSYFVLSYSITTNGLHT